MSGLDWLLIGGIALAVFWAVRVCIRNRTNGKNCSGDCSNCSGCGK